jgi:hypothetical protein
MRLAFQLGCAERTAMGAEKGHRAKLLFSVNAPHLRHYKSLFAMSSLNGTAFGLSAIGAQSCFVTYTLPVL